jgi:hypothetical protein
MDNRWLHAYIDETGTNELDVAKPGVSRFFICVAVVLEGSGTIGMIEHLDSVADELCSGAEITSKRIGGNHERRQKFLDRIKDLPFGYYAMVIRKESVPEESGLQYKRSFYKCINKMLYRKLASGGRSIKIIADTIGGADFMDSFQDYLNRQLKPDLFSDYTHEFRDSSECCLIQLADLIAGTLSQCFEPEKRGEHSTQFRRVLSSKELGIDTWPLESAESAFIDPNQDNSDAKVDISTPMLQRITNFVHAREQSGDPIHKMQVEVIRMLRFAREFEESSRQRIHSDELMARLAHRGFEEIGKRAFTKEIIGEIRLQGIILAGSQSGYRLALTLDDIKDYLEHNRNIIEPMISKLSKARQSVRHDTANAVDILGNEPFRLLAKLVESAFDFETSVKLDSKI